MAQPQRLRHHFEQTAPGDRLGLHSSSESNLRHRHVGNLCKIAQSWNAGIPTVLLSKEEEYAPM
jgi:hypothetical protein